MTDKKVHLPLIFLKELRFGELLSLFESHARTQGWTREEIDSVLSPIRGASPDQYFSAILVVFDYLEIE